MSVQNKKPVIGVIPQYDPDQGRIFVSANYFRALRDSGAVPFLLPLQSAAEDVQRLIDMADGILYTGGPDVSPLLFGEETIPGCGTILPDRDRLELSVLPLVMERDLPVLGICRGIQTLNIGLGGDIYQDIVSQYHPEGVSPVGHSQKSAGAVATHSVFVEKGTLLYEIVKKERIEVNSFHHQTVRRLAPDVVCAGRSADGLTEAIARPGSRFFLGVQWHPEYLYPESEDAKRIFEAFVQACRPFGRNS